MLYNNVYVYQWYVLFIYLVCVKTTCIYTYALQSISVYAYGCVNI